MIELQDRIHVFDDLFTPEEIGYVARELTSPGFPWNFGVTRDKTVSNESYVQLADENTFEQFQLVHWFVVKSQWTPTAFSNVIRLVFSRIGRQIGSSSLKVERVKGNLQTRTSTSGTYNTPHLDGPDPGFFVAIYYVNDCDGRTYIFGNREKPFTILDVVESKAGRVVVFDGSYFHAGCHPRKDDFRMVINFNFRV